MNLTGIWEKQAEFHEELTVELKKEIRNIIIFYQRRLKSQKGLISFCEFEKREVVVEEDGRKKNKTVGCQVIPPFASVIPRVQNMADLE